MNNENLTKTEANIDYHCEECGNQLPKELIKELIKGNIIYCEDCGAKNAIKQDSILIPEAIKSDSLKIKKGSKPQKAEILKITPSQFSPPRKKLFFIRVKNFYRRLFRINRRRSKRSRHRHRGGR